MNKKIKLITCLALLVIMCLSLAGCGSQKTKFDEYYEKGYTVKVSYHANGGKYFNRNGVTIVDMFNPSDYEVGGDGKVHIKLTDPTDPSRPESGNESIVLTKTENFLAGWYKTRILVTNDKGQPVDDNGQVLIEKDGLYYYPADDKSDDEELDEAFPAYTYADPWDFATDTVDYDPATGLYELDLYAGWVKYFTFEYYYQEDGVWKNYATTNFDYKTTNQPGSPSADHDNVYLPRWNDGQMDHNTTLNNEGLYTFPKKEKSTFVAAYEDEACTLQISNMITHPGTVDYKHGVGVNAVKKIYVKFEDGEKYKISTADQLIKYAKSYGEYEILNDLDFKDKTWPQAFTNTVFTGKLFGTNGTTVTLRDVTATYSASVGFGGLFGKVGEGAVIKNVSFVNATLDVATVGATKADMSYGLLSGEISQDATVEDLSVSGTLKLGPVKLGDDYSLNLIADGAYGRVQNNGVKLIVYGGDITLDPAEPKFRYFINPQSVAISADDSITAEFYVIEEELNQASYNINF